MDRDVLPEVLLSKNVVRKWMARAKRVAEELVRRGYSPSQIPEERGEIRDGQLVIYVEVDDLRIEMTVPDGEWEWIDEATRN